VARVVDGAVIGVGMGHAVITARSPWDSAAASDVYVVGDLLLFAARNGRWNVYMADRGDLSTVRPLTQDTLRESELAWSPDWRHVAYTVTASGRSDYSDLYVANADGSAAARLTDDSAKVSSPSFVGPSGEEVVFESNRGAGERRAQLYAIKVDGSGRHQLTRGAPHSQPDVSPDGTKVLYVALENQRYDVYQMSVDGSGQQRLTNDSRRDDAPEYAADGRSFYFLRLEGGRPPTRRLYRQELAAGAAAVPVTPTGVYVQAYSVGPDGGTLALTVLEPRGDGSAVPRVELFNVATQTARPVVVPGLDPIGGVVFRPARQPAPQP
jgi:Tol biopolymer transport system component